MNTIKKHQNNVISTLALLDIDEINKAVSLLRKVREANGTVWLAGNGGSAATAEHFANDLLKMGGIRAIALPAMTPTATAYGNDNGWENMYKHMMLGLTDGDESNDALVAISCSGNSPNVVELSRWWIDNLIVLTGDKRKNNLLANISLESINIHVESGDITVQEDVHMVICHSIINALRE